MSNFSLCQSKLLVDDFHPKVTAYYFKTLEQFYMDNHTHDDLEIMYVIQGNCVVNVEQQPITLKKGDFILLDANLAHQLLVEKGNPCRMLNIEFSFTGKKGIFPSLKELATENKRIVELLTFCDGYIVLKDANEIYHTLKHLVLELDKKEDEKDVMVQLHLTQLFIQITRIMIEEKERKNKQQQTNVYIKKVIEYLHHHYDCELRMQVIAEVVNLHPGYLHRIFKKQMGVTVMEYLTGLRIEKAKMLLADTDIPIIDVSSFVGINSRQYFSLLFKKYTLQSPLAYRKCAQQNIQKFSYK
ncbi:AraC family transcriptional regulator [Halalkalibacter urbisdiaboli]|uniref:AraC family transcriptional regulator n=1 Tax=Halalkalibacter urbisdiaboli TaxID=1960589 RepID=UPI000B4391E5|nr:AraC family transcriptional regulator [Halalkalibacter urbisdiaboli]